METSGKPLLTVGVDNATKTGVVVYDPVKDVIIRQVLVQASTDKEVPEQLMYLYDVVQKILEPYKDAYDVRVFTEAPYLHISPKLAGRAPVFIHTFGRLKGIEAVIQVACIKSGVSVQSVPIRSHQAFTKKLLGIKVKGRDETKKAFQEGFTKLYGSTFQSNDISDALSIALYGTSLIKE